MLPAQVCLQGAEACTLISATMNTLLNLAIVAGILGASFLLTELFVRKMYYRCRQCGALNAKRRAQCRGCGEALP